MSVTLWSASTESFAFNLHAKACYIRPNVRIDSIKAHLVLFLDSCEQYHQHHYKFMALFPLFCVSPFYIDLHDSYHQYYL